MTFTHLRTMIAAAEKECAEIELIVKIKDAERKRFSRRQVAFHDDQGIIEIKAENWFGKIRFIHASEIDYVQVSAVRPKVLHPINS